MHSSMITGILSPLCPRRSSEVEPLRAIYEGVNPLFTERWGNDLRVGNRDLSRYGNQFCSLASGSEGTAIPPVSRTLVISLSMSKALPLVKIPSNATIHRFGSPSTSVASAILRFPKEGWTIPRSERAGWAVVGDGEGRRLAVEVRPVLFPHGSFMAY